MVFECFKQSLTRAPIVALVADDGCGHRWQLPVDRPRIRGSRGGEASIRFVLAAAPISVAPKVTQRQERLADREQRGGMGNARLALAGRAVRYPCGRLEVGPTGKLRRDPRLRLPMPPR
jgi:hypothetical protein